MQFRLLTVAVCVLAVLAAGCGSVSNARKIDYRSTRVLPPLEVPPDLSSLPESERAAAAGSGPATYSGYAGVQQARGPGARQVLPQYPDVRLARAGETRYVVVEAEPGAVWDEVREFLEQTGLVVEQADPAAGLMETNWAENRALVGGKNSFTKWFKSFFSTGVRDKYRVRLERGVAPGTTEIYITHEGMEEIALDEDAPVAQPGWKPRPRDSTLEAEMLQRLVAHLGGSVTEASVVAQPQTAPAAAAPEERPEPPGARLVRDGEGAPRLALEDSLERAWRRVGLSLDRIGFTVEDRDRAKGIYYVRYIDPENREEPGFFSRMLGNENPTPPTQYQVRLIPDENGTRVEVQGANGDPTSGGTGERILSLLYEQLK